MKIFMVKKSHTYLNYKLSTMKIKNIEIMRNLGISMADIFSGSATPKLN